MNIRPSTDRSTVVNLDTKWIPIDANTPRGTKLQLINIAAGVAHYGQLQAGDTFYTHWFPLPTFDKDKS